jgi:transcriptional regulator with XRE-family HTH domain
MMDETRKIEARRLWEVDGLTMRQIAEKMGMGRKTVSRILAGDPAPHPRKPAKIAPYERLIAEWYKDTPALMAIQVLNRLRGYGYTGGYGTIKLATMAFRKKRPQAFLRVDLRSRGRGAGGLDDVEDRDERGLRVRLYPGLVAL